jgi:hypothetical protein
MPRCTHRRSFYAPLGLIPRNWALRHSSSLLEAARAAQISNHRQWLWLICLDCESLPQSRRLPIEGG